MNKQVKQQLLVLMAFICLVMTFVFTVNANDKVQSNLLTGLFCDDPRLGMAVIKQESSFNNVMSEEGSIGLMQVREGTARMIGCVGVTQKQLMIPLLNVQCGCKYLNTLSKKYNKQSKVIAAYNAGSPRLCVSGILFPSGKKCSIGLFVNQYYVNRVTNNYKGIL